jgi:hypothetical protein
MGGFPSAWPGGLQISENSEPPGAGTYGGQGATTFPTGICWVM